MALKSLKQQEDGIDIPTVESFLILLKAPINTSFTDAHQAIIQLRLDELAIDLNKLDSELDGVDK